MKMAFKNQMKVLVLRLAILISQASIFSIVQDKEETIWSLILNMA